MGSTIPKSKGRFWRLNKRATTILLGWFLALIAVDGVFQALHPTTNPNAPDGLSDTFNVVWTILLIGGLIGIPWWYRKKKPDHQLPNASNL